MQINFQNALNVATQQINRIQTITVRQGIIASVAISTLCTLGVYLMQAVFSTRKFVLLSALSLLPTALSLFVSLRKNRSRELKYNLKELQYHLKKEKLQELSIQLDAWVAIEGGQAEKASRLIKEAFKSNATRLDLSGLKLITLPPQIGSLTYLENLDLRKNRLRALPDSIGNLVNLKEFDLSRNQLASVPNVIGNLIKLTSLNLSENRLGILPDSIGYLVNLTELLLYNNQLNTIPDSIQNLVNLTFLELSVNRLGTVPDSISNLANLIKLDLSGNQLKTIPEWITNKVNLRELFLSHNQFTILPDSIINLINLTTLNFSSNLFTTIPNSIGNLVNLKTFNLSNNLLTIIPETIGALINLKELNLQQNQLTAIPNSIGNLVNLSWVDLEKNRLIAIPESIGNLVNLHYLYVSHNQITTIPDSICNLVNLIELQLSHNKLTCISTQVGRLASLRYFDILGNHNLSELPLSLGQCSEIMDLDISGTIIHPERVDEILNMCRAQRDQNALQVLPPRLHAWQKASGKEFDLAFITQSEGLNQEQRQNINEWLMRLERTSDYTTALQQALAEAACGMLQTLRDSASFKEVFFAQVSGNLVACGDRAAMSFNELYLAWKLATLDPHASENDKLQLIVRAAKTITLRNSLQNRISRREAQLGQPISESVEIFLYYETHLKQPLNLLTFMSGMLYDDMGRCNWIDENALVAEVNNTCIDQMLDLPSLIPLRDADENFIVIWQPKKIDFDKRMDKLEEQRGTMLDNDFNEGNKALMRESEIVKREQTKKWLVNKLHF
jgi:Leucine-rich repeat (LRR) protein